MESEIGKMLGARMRKLREARSLTQSQLAGLLLKSVETISNFERGKTAPGLLTIAQIAELLGVQPKHLFDFDELLPVAELEADVALITRRLGQLSPADRAFVRDFIEIIVRHPRS
jgi:transcriptional regulator with XRE-family HTH domain